MAVLRPIITVIGGYPPTPLFASLSLAFIMIVGAGRSSSPTSPKIPDRRITAFFERCIDPLHDYVMNFAALLEGGLAQRFVDRFWQVEARMDNV